MMRRYLFALGLAAAALLATLPGVAQTPQKVSVGALRLASSGAIFIAQEKGYFREQGLEVEIKTFTAAQQVPVAVTSGDVDFGVTGLTAGFFNLAGKGALKIIAGQSREEPGFQLVAYMVTNQALAKGFGSLKDFAGKRVGTTTVGSTFHYSLGLLARKYGFDIASVQLVPLQSLPNMAAAFKGGQVDAVLAPVNVARALEKDDAGKIIGWVGDETPWQLGALFTSPRLVETRRSVAEQFLRAYQRASADYNRAFNGMDAQGKPVKGPGYDELIGIVSRAVQQPPELVATGLPFVDPEARLNVQDIYDQVAFWQSQGQVDRGVDAKAILDLSFVKGHFNLPR
ncbi:MAG: ABC transporter substrate-binding protein [Proteobacteria bacterium]|nr:ABC transporter substrate-binding protein [Pseudomonadota bacterium]